MQNIYLRLLLIIFTLLSDFLIITIIGKLFNLDFYFLLKLCGLMYLIIFRLNCSIKSKELQKLEYWIN